MPIVYPANSRAEVLSEVEGDGLLGEGLQSPGGGATVTWGRGYSLLGERLGRGWAAELHTNLEHSCL